MLLLLSPLPLGEAAACARGPFAMKAARTPAAREAVTPPGHGLSASGHSAVDARRAAGAPDGARARPLNGAWERSAHGAKDGLARAIGRTPLVALKRLGPPGGPTVALKLEGANPGGSVKDRAASRIIAEAERSGLLGPGRTLLDASSGNTGVAYAMLCARRRYSCLICLPANASADRRRLLEAYGAGVVLTDPEEGSDGAIREARRRAEAHPDRFFYADQYANPANVAAHYETTGREIWRQTGGRVTHFVAMLGTGGTFTGTGRRLRECAPGVRLTAVQPDSPLHGIEGAKHMATAMVPPIYDASLADELEPVTTEEAQEMAVRLAREEGLLGGASGGANVVAALRVAARARAVDVIVTLLPEGGARYLEDSWWRSP
ncbi:MAG TPA: cysteine synthase family protein [Longimicrobiales bacterium]|nr:cysteine synthase family protein [Longimicrobiales bacterium]